MSAKRQMPGGYRVQGEVAKAGLDGSRRGDRRLSSALSGLIRFGAAHVARDSATVGVRKVAI